MLLELAIGDAYGAGFEYVKSREFIRENNSLQGYIEHPRHNQKPGTYTDDTQMSLALAELIVEGKSWTPESIAAKFAEVFHRDVRKGYAGGFYAFLKKTTTAQDFLENIKPHSDKSGAAMRAGPIGIYPDIKKVIARSAMQAKLTHNTSDGIRAAVAASLMVHYFLYNMGRKEDLPDFLCQHVPGRWNEPWEGKIGSKGWMSVRAAITSLINNNSLSEILKSCIAWGGDTDTVATIALAAASCNKTIKKDLPESLIRGLENGKYGKDHLINMDKILLKKMNS